MKARTTCARRVPQTAQPPAVMAMSQREESSSCCSVMRLRSRPTSTRPTMAHRTAARQHQSVPVEADAVHSSQSEGEHESHEAGEAAHDTHGAQPEHHLGIGEGLQAQQVLLAGEGLTLLAVLAHLVRLVRPHLLRPAARQHGQPGARHRGTHEHNGGEDEDGRGADDLVEDTAGIDATKPASVPRSVSRALSVA